jgi:hypothetical protein
MSCVSQTTINEYRDEQIHFLQLHLGGDRNFCYVLGELRSGQAAVVDPGFRANQLGSLKFLSIHTSMPRTKLRHRCNEIQIASIADEIIPEAVMRSHVAGVRTGLGCLTIVA